MKSTFRKNLTFCRNISSSLCLLLKHNSSKKAAEVGEMVGLLLNPEDEGDMSIRNLGLSTVIHYITT
jgi:hypothetical protein